MMWISFIWTGVGLASLYALVISLPTIIKFKNDVQNYIKQVEAVAEIARNNREALASLRSKSEGLELKIEILEQMEKK